MFVRAEFMKTWNYSYATRQQIIWLLMLDRYPVLSVTLDFVEFELPDRRKD